MKLLLKTMLAVIVTVLYSGWALAITPEQVIQLKKAGVSEETIRLMMQQERDGKQPTPPNTPVAAGVRETKDATGSTSVVYSTGSAAPAAQNESEHDKVEKAWKMLHNMIIDSRGRGDTN